MEEEKNRLEIERIRNLVQGFGWSVSKQELTDTEIIIELRKPRVGAEIPLGLGAE